MSTINGKLYQYVAWIFIVLLLADDNIVHAQDYRDYADSYAQQDNLYTDYAMKQKQKGDDVAPGGGGMQLLKTTLIGGAGWFFGGKFHAKRTVTALKKKHTKDQKNLYSQYYNDVYKLQQQNAELAYLVEQYQTALKQTEQDRENEAVQRDYDEFKQPDIDGDDRISRAEFNMYVKNYLSNYPGLDEKDYPTFEDFDHDGDGFIGFQEYAQQMALKVQQAEKKQYKTQQGSKSTF
mmetsp:Transcript_19177/g.26993  ORF Transcript_19177/g.26993 Transcript_19177/m.26993 type:complete len:235 (+) Transcript_19177:141-845(+)|eukprot:CAMPEP_0184855536 /NCGR_PEP_ID=MMETSP0580-20130426/752_1 /TAXON_ID=1118495 /ORGANISM="Dactyliosolen fragilissimus" /LENGTH=234 /DNA_ID=CAMNT_0027350071 /DNA_START=54 /DNA_END=758 /DNA_ORIENTATION=-